MKKAFTMIEIVFVLVILGILAGIAMPKLFLTRSDALVLKARDEVAKVNAALLAHGQEQMYKTGFISFPYFNCDAKVKGSGKPAVSSTDPCIIKNPFKTPSTYFINLFQSGSIQEYTGTNNIGWGKVPVSFTNDKDYRTSIFDPAYDAKNNAGVKDHEILIRYITENKQEPKTYYFVYNYKAGRLECVNPSDWTSKSLSDYPALECW